VPDHSAELAELNEQLQDVMLEVQRGGGGMVASDVMADVKGRRLAALPAG